MYLNTKSVVGGIVCEGLSVESWWRIYVGKVFESHSINPKDVRRKTTDPNHYGKINQSKQKQCFLSVSTHAAFLYGGILP